MHFIRRNQAFTLVELLIVIAIVAIISIVVVLILNPSAVLQQARDANRLSDLTTLNRAINFFSSENSAVSGLGVANTIYVSIPDPLATSTAGDQCQGLGLTSVASSGYTYQCAASSTYRRTNGTGWIPVNFNRLTYGPPFSALPIDPVNTTSSGFYYTYTTDGQTYELTGAMEAAQDKSGGSADKASTDGGGLSNTYETGSLLTLEPNDYGSPFNNGYTYRKTITVAANLISPASGTTLTNFPMLISGTYPYLAGVSSGGSVQNINGYDIIFTSDAAGTNKLNWETENYISSTGAVIYWVQVPTLSPSNNKIYMFYDKASISTDQSNRVGTWSGSYEVVYHLGKNGEVSFNDSTGNGYGGTNSGSNATSGAIGTGYILNGQYFTASGANMNSWTSQTISFWAYQTGSLDWGRFMEKGSNNEWTIAQNGSGGVFVEAGDGNPKINTTSSLLGAWHAVTFTIDPSNNLILYIDGVNNGTGLGASGGSKTGILNVGQQGGGGYSANTNIDEVRVSNAVLTPDWVKTEYNNQSSPATFYSIQ